MVRESGGGNANRLLVLPTLHTSSDQGRLDALAAELAELRDPMVATTVHFYGWWPFGVNITGCTRFDAASEQDLTATFDRVYNSFTARGIPVVIGDYALLAYDHPPRHHPAGDSGSTSSSWATTPVGGTSPPCRGTPVSS
ncbi:cellulase family glycosylhydrolase [Streptomyces europaeiscabiei]|uniref:cellulase family glycosylhydrolase n=1 Tax=Streptomyces europaeiscabiei TaxID=146819 RepID=UPI0029C0E746|nr:cellulase family glycosylhydrolase [Streptomyces europaeiscabiei]